MCQFKNDYSTELMYLKKNNKYFDFFFLNLSFALQLKYV